MAAHVHGGEGGAFVAFFGAVEVVAALLAAAVAVEFFQIHRAGDIDFGVERPGALLKVHAGEKARFGAGKDESAGVELVVIQLAAR